MAIRALIVEDEPLARDNLREWIASEDWLELAGEAADGLSAVRSIDELRPELVFLDVQLPELTGLEVLERVAHRPAVVFTTAFDRYAVAAFELEAIDYLVKPFGRKRFREMLERVRRRLESEEAPTEDLDRARAALGKGSLERLFAREGDRVLPIAVSSVTRIEARGDYAEIHAGARAYLLHVTLSELESRLDGERFLRVHRSHIVNLDFVREMRPYGDRRLVLVLEDGAEVLASRLGSQRLRELIR